MYHLGSPDTAITRHAFTEVGGDFVLTDHIMGGIIGSHVIPPSLTEAPHEYQEQMREGFAFLAAHGPAIRYTLLLTQHSESTDITDAGIDVREEMLKTARRNGRFFLELAEDVATQESFISEFNAVTAGQTPIANKYTDDSFDRGFTDSLLAAAHNTSVRGMIADVTMSKDIQQPLAYMYEQWSREWVAAEDERHLYGTGIAQEALAEVTFNNYREWHMIGLMGCAGVLDMTTLVGDSHATLAQKMRIAAPGSQVVQKGNDVLAPTFEPRTYIDHLAQQTLMAIQSGRLTPAHIAALQSVCPPGIVTK